MTLLGASDALDDNVVTIPVLEIRPECSPTMLLTPNTMKPITGLPDTFWQEFRAQSITVLEREYYERLRDHILVLPFLMHFWIGPAIEDELILHSISLTVYLTGAFFVHSGLAKEFFHMVATMLYPVQAIAFGLFFLGFKCYIDTALLFLLAIISCFCFPCVNTEQDVTIRQYLQTVSVYCQSHSNGYAIEYRRERQSNFTKFYFVFQRQRPSAVAETAAAELDEEGGYLPLTPTERETTVDVIDLKLQFRLFLYDPSSACFHMFGKQHQVEDDDYVLSKMIPITSYSPPPGIPPQAWMELIHDLSDDIQANDTFFRKTLVVVVLYIAISITCFVVYGAVNYLLPVHMACPFIAVILARRRMARKLDVINKLEGLTFTSSIAYHVSYHTAHWYSPCNDYILFQRKGSREDGNFQVDCEKGVL